MLRRLTGYRPMFQGDVVHQGIDVATVIELEIFGEHRVITPPGWRADYLVIPAFMDAEFTRPGHVVVRFNLRRPGAWWALLKTAIAWPFRRHTTYPKAE